MPTAKVLIVFMQDVDAHQSGKVSFQQRFEIEVNNLWTIEIEEDIIINITFSSELLRFFVFARWVTLNNFFSFWLLLQQNGCASWKFFLSQCDAIALIFLIYLVGSMFNSSTSYSGSQVPSSSHPDYFSSRQVYNNDGFHEEDEGEDASTKKLSGVPTSHSPFDSSKPFIVDSTIFSGISAAQSYTAPDPSANHFAHSLQLGPAAPPSQLMHSHVVSSAFHPLPPTHQHHHGRLPSEPPYTPLENNAPADLLRHDALPPRAPTVSTPTVLSQPSSRAFREYVPPGETPPDIESDAGTDQLAPPPPETVCVVEAQSAARQVKDSLLRLCGSDAHFFSREDRANFMFLNDTVALLVSYLDSQVYTFFFTTAYCFISSLILLNLKK